MTGFKTLICDKPKVVQQGNNKYGIKISIKDKVALWGNFLDTYVKQTYCCSLRSQSTYGWFCPVYKQRAYVFAGVRWCSFGELNQLPPFETANSESFVDADVIYTIFKRNQTAYILYKTEQGINLCVNNSVYFRRNMG